MKEEEAKAASKGKGKSKAMQILSGRALFQYDPSLFKEDDEMDDGKTELKPMPEEEEKKESELKDEKGEEPVADDALFAAEAENAADEEEPDFD